MNFISREPPWRAALAAIVFSAALVLITIKYFME